MSRWDELRAKRARIARFCPKLAVGDEWTGIAGSMERITITRIEPIEDMPWPRVYYTDPDGIEGHTGAPAFKFGRLVRRGKGEQWDPPQ